MMTGTDSFWLGILEEGGSETWRSLDRWMTREDDDDGDDGDLSTFLRGPSGRGCGWPVLLCDASRFRYTH